MDMHFPRRLARLALPIAFQSLMLAMVAACDAFMLGRVSQDAMSAVSLASQVQFLQNMALFSVTAAAAILGAQYWGKGDRESIGRIFRICLRTVGYVSVTVALACVACPRALMHIFAKSGPLVEIGASYLRIAGLSYLLTGLSQSYLTILKVTDHVARASLISAGAVLLNIVLNAVFIYGWLGVPALGVRGAALATLLARVVELVAAVTASHRPECVRPEWRRILEAYPELARDFRHCGLPLLGAAFFWGIGFASYTAVMGHLGEDTAAANSVAAVIRDLLCCVTDGMAAGGGILVGNELGAGHLATGRLYGQRLAALSVAVGLAVMGVILLLAPVVPAWGWLDLTAAARSHLRGMLAILAVYMVGRCINTVVINGVFSAGGDTLFDVYSLAVCMWGLAVPLSILGAFVFRWNVLLVYACTCVDEVGKLPWVYAHFRRYKWVRDLTR